MHMDIALLWLVYIGLIVGKSHQKLLFIVKLVMWPVFGRKYLDLHLVSTTT